MKAAGCIALLIASASAAGCAASDAPDDRDPRFAGRWFLEETQAHALYGASTYAFGADGTISLIWDAGFYQVPLGHVRSPDDAVTCAFGAGWRSEGSARLAIDVECDDATTRELVLGFSNPAATNAAGADVAILSVDGDGGWMPPTWGWSFRKCEPGDDCVP